MERTFGGRGGMVTFRDSLRRSFFPNLEIRIIFKGKY